jgi:hypothetical protein
MVLPLTLHGRAGRSVRPVEQRKHARKFPGIKQISLIDEICEQRSACCGLRERNQMTRVKGLASRYC